MPEEKHHESNWVWGTAGVACSILLTVGAAIRHDLRPLLYVAWFLFGVSTWKLCHHIRNRIFRWTVTFVVFTTIGIGLFRFGKWLGTEEIRNSSTRQSKIEHPPQSFPTAHEIAEEIAKRQDQTKARVGRFDVPTSEDDFTPIFKNSSLFTDLRRTRVKSELLSFRSYMRSVGFFLPKESPAFAITPPSNSGSTITMNMPGRWSTLSIEESQIDNMKWIRHLYSDFLVRKLLEPSNPSFIEEGLRFYAIFLLGTYFTASSLDDVDVPPAVLPHWMKVLWQIRRKVGIHTADEILANTIYAIRDYPSGADNGVFDGWFYRRIREANSVTDNDGSRWLLLDQIIRDTIHP